MGYLRIVTASSALLPLHRQGPSFAAQARFLSRNARVKRLKLAAPSEQAHLLGTREPLLTAGRAGQRSRELLTTCGRSWSRAARLVALRWQARRVKLLLSVDEHGCSLQHHRLGSGCARECMQVVISRSKCVLSVSMLETSEQSHSWSSLSVLSTSSTRPGGRPISCSLQLQLVQGRVSLRVDSSKSTLLSAEYDLDFAQRLPKGGSQGLRRWSAACMISLARLQSRQRRCCYSLPTS